MRKTSMIIAGIAVAGIAAVGGSAFTGTGVTSNAGPTQYVGGTVSQTVTGATLSSIVYAYGDVPANTKVHTATLTFADADADLKTPTVVVSGTSVLFDCTAIDVDDHVSTCTAVGGTDATGVSGIAVTVI